MNYIEVENLSFKYDKEPVLANINYSQADGEFVMLTGENGAAKTTLVKNILGLLEPYSGSATLSPLNIFGSKLQVGYIAQSVANFNAGFPSTVYELVQSGRYPLGKWFKPLDSEDHEFINWAIDLVGLNNYKDSAIGELSGGQKQRLSIARVLASQPDLYILDEPTTGMDKRSRVVLYEYLRTESHERGKSVLAVTHESDEMINYVDRHVRLVREENASWKSFSMISCD